MSKKNLCIPGILSELSYLNEKILLSKFTTLFIILLKVDIY